MTHTPNQKRAIEVFRDRVCVDAGAGSGKTRVLVERIVHILDRGLAELDQIVAITFTDAAAAEMKIRLRREFRHRAPMDDPDAMTRWRNRERYVEMARVSTIHSFCAGLLRENALRVGLDPDFTVLAEAEAQLLRNDVVTQTIHRLLEAGDEAAVRCTAEYGTSKFIGSIESLLTKQRMMERMCAAHPLDDSQALLDHWKGIVAEVTAERVRELQTSRELTEFRAALAAFDGLCAKPTDGRETIRREKVALLDEIASGTDTDRILEAVRQLTLTKAGKASKKEWSPTADLEQLKRVLEDVQQWAMKAQPAAVDESVERRAAEMTADVYHTYRQVSDAFHRAKADRTSLDFDDMIAMTVEMLRNNEEIRTRTAQGIRYLLIDEFQDTDASQLEIARLLVDCPGGPQLFLVGDAKQSIYDFRGAEVELFQGERAQAQEQIVLADNFRTVPEVLEFANDFFERTQLLSAVEPQYGRLASGRDGAGECRVEFLLPPEDETLLADGYRGEEATLIASRLAAMCRGPERVMVGGGDDARPADYGDVAMLFRSSTNMYLYERALREWGIPYNVVAGMGFFERQEVTDLRNLLTVVADPWDETALLGFLRSPLGTLSDESLVHLCAERGLVPAFCGESVPAGFPQADRLESARRLIHDLRLQSPRPLAEFLRYVMERTGYEAIALSQFLGLQKALNVRKIIDMAEDFARTRPADLPAFVRYMDTMKSQETREGDATLDTAASGSVTLMTIHKSKGLEFPIVVVPDISQESRDQGHDSILVDRRLGMVARFVDDKGDLVTPAMYESIKRVKGSKREAEHARILYVAMTRARDWLLLSGAPKTSGPNWMNTFDKYLDVTRRGNGDVIQKEKWSARIRRVPDTRAARQAPKTTEATPIDLSAIERRANPVSLTMAARNTFSVSEILDEIAAAHGVAAHGVAAHGTTVEKPAHADSTGGLLRGTLVHRLLEQWDLVNEPPIDWVLDSECVDPVARERLSTYLGEVAVRFRGSALMARMRPARLVQREVPFLLRVNDALISGVLDALIDGGEIIDYKTGRQTPERTARYEHQLRLYAAAVARLTGQWPGKALVYYTDYGEEAVIGLEKADVEATMVAAERAIASLRAKAIACGSRDDTAEWTEP